MPLGVGENAAWSEFWSEIAVAATAALERLPADHERSGEALFAVNAARLAAHLPPLPPR